MLNSSSNGVPGRLLGRMRCLRRQRLGRRRQSRVPRPLRPPASRPGVGRDRLARGAQDPRGARDGLRRRRLRRRAALPAAGPDGDRARPLLDGGGLAAPERPADRLRHRAGPSGPGAQRQPRQRPGDPGLARGERGPLHDDLGLRDDPPPRRPLEGSDPHGRDRRGAGETSAGRTRSSSSPARGFSPCAIRTASAPSRSGIREGLAGRRLGDLRLRSHRRHISSATSSRGRSCASRARGSRRTASPSRSRPPASSSTSTSPGPTRRCSAGASRLRDRGSAAAWPGSTPRRPTSSWPVPDSGMYPALGYAEESGIPFALGLVRNHYVGRTFIEPKQSIRHFGVKVKLNPVREVVEGKRVVLVDDSIVRGTTSRKIVRMLREAGRERGPRPGLLAADHQELPLRHRHADERRADRGEPVRRGDPQVHRGGHPGLPVGRGHAGHLRPAPAGDLHGVLHGHLSRRDRGRGARERARARVQVGSARRA